MNYLKDVPRSAVVQKETRQVAQDWLTHFRDEMVLLSLPWTAPTAPYIWEHPTEDLIKLSWHRDERSLYIEVSTRPESSITYRRCESYDPSDFRTFIGDASLLENCRLLWHWFLSPPATTKE